MLEGALADGIATAGGDALLAGVLPTPAASLLVRKLGLDLAAIVSASHNPWQDNGIKFFGPQGAKLTDEHEAAIEERVEGLLASEQPGVATRGAIEELHAGLDDYLRGLTTAHGIDLSGQAIVLDCANGATYEAAPEIFTRLGAAVEVLAAEPDGRNINEACGSTHPEALAARVAESDATIGFAFDGDGDRLIAVDGSGVIRDGDELIALVARDLHRRGELVGTGVAVTVMSNFGFHTAMKEAGIEVATTPVGDRHVSAELRRRGWSLGGEQSGHVIWTEFAPTGDGISTALLTLRALGGGELADARPMERLPQRLVNVPIANRGAVDGATAVWEAVEREQSGLEGRGRVLVRASGTEPLLRVMAEAPTQEECDEVCRRLVAVVESELG